MANSVEDYVSRLPEPQQSVARSLMQTILAAAPDLTAAIKWGQPIFESNGPVCYFKAHKHHVTFGFWRGATLLKLDDGLESSGSKMAHMKLTGETDLKPARIRKLLKAAIKLNREEGNPTLGRKAKSASSYSRAPKRTRKSSR